MWVATGCGEPQCPNGYFKRDDTCYRIKDGGVTDAGDELDAGEVELDASNSPVTAGDSGTDARDGEANTGSDAEPAAMTDGSSDPCLGSDGAAVCIGSAMYRCSPQEVTESTETCASAQQCQLGIAADRCAPCMPGTFQCQEVRLERCADDGSGWTLFTTCDSAALCNPTAGACTDKACTPTTRVCTGDTLNGCNASLTALEPIRTCDAGMCDQAQGECDVCVANAKGCQGDVAVGCDANGRQESRNPCQGTTPRCTGNGRCVQCINNSDCTGAHELCVDNRCEVQPYCSDGKVTASEGEACDPMDPRWNAWTCNAQCQVATTYTSCSGNTDDPQAIGCRTGEFCTVGVCVSRCNVPADCPPVPANSNLQATCINSVCFATDCSTARDCAPGLVCSPPATSGWAPTTTNFCRACSSTLKCPSGTTCQNLSPDGSQGRCLAE